MAGSKLKLLLCARASSSPPPTPDIVGGTDYALAPVVQAQTLYRTPLVDVGDELVDMQRDVAMPYSPKATSWTLGGTDAAYFTVSGQYMVFNPATRASVPKGGALSITLQAHNAYGSSAPVGVSVFVPADANCRFFSFETGDDANAGTSPSAPKRQVPGSVGYTGSAVTYGGGIVCFFRGGENHRYSIAGALNVVWPALLHAGSSLTDRVVFRGTGYGTSRAILAGDDEVSGDLPVADANAVFGNPNWSNIRVVTMADVGGSLLGRQNPFSGPYILYEAQVPAPAEPLLNEGTQDMTEQQGFYMIPLYRQASAPAGPGPWMWQTVGNGGDVTIKDARITAAFCDMEAGDFSYPTNPYKLKLWRNGNFIALETIKSYDPANDTVVVEWNNTPTGNRSVNSFTSGVTLYSSYSLVGMPVLITRPNQYAMSIDGADMYFHPSNAADQLSISRRSLAVALGGRHYLDYGEFVIRRVAAPADNVAAGGFVNNTSGAGIGQRLTGIDLEQCFADGAGVSLTGGAGSGMLDGNIERWRIRECPGSGTFRFAARFDALIETGGTETIAQALGWPTSLDDGYIEKVEGHAYCKIRWNFWDDLACDGTCLLATYSDGIHIYENFLRRQAGVHGNVFSLYTTGVASGGIFGTGTYNVNFIKENNFIFDAERPDTLSISNSGVVNKWRNGRVRRNIYLAAVDLAANAIQGQDHGSWWHCNIIAQVPGGTYTNTYYIGNPVVPVKITNSLVPGIGLGVGATKLYDIQDNVSLYNNIPPNVDADHVALNNRILSPEGASAWDPFTQPIPAEWADSFASGGLLPGQYGVFAEHAIA